MIRTEAQAEKLKVSFTVQANSTRYLIDFISTFHSDFEASAAQYFISECLGNLVEELRRNAYNDGWKDAKSKKVRKKTHFFRSLHHTMTGY